jgi:signal transduction histidine kinase
VIRGVRARITAIAAILVLIVLGATGLALVTVQRTVLTESVDEVLQRHTTQVADALGATGIPSELPAGDDDDAFAVVLDADGARIASTPDPAPTIGLTDIPAGFSTVGTADGDYRVQASIDGDRTIVVGTPLDDVNESVATLTRGLLIAVPLATLLLAVGAWLLVGRAFRPVEAIRAQVETISAASLDRRVPVPNTGDEVAALAVTMNDMLERLELAAERERRFIADASHELRTPLARMRTALEVDATYPDKADPAATREGLLDSTTSLAALVDDLLLLTRTADPDYRPPRSRVDLDDLVLLSVSRIPAGSLVPDLSGLTAAQVVGDGNALARVIDNLLENAIRHGGGSVAITVRERDDHAELVIEDDGPGVPPADRERIFDRFARLDDSRATGTGGTGLGLAIAREVVQAHGGTIVVTDSRLGGARFEVRLPTG